MFIASKYKEIWTSFKLIRSDLLSKIIYLKILEQICRVLIKRRKKKFEQTRF